MYKYEGIFCVDSTGILLWILQCMLCLRVKENVSKINRYSIVLFIQWVKVKKRERKINMEKYYYCPEK